MMGLTIKFELNKKNKQKIFISSIVIFLYINIISKKKLNKIDLDNQITEYENNIDFSNFTTDIKAIALYLPQFHEIKENNKWWGKGFTEWVNVKKCLPLYKGHHQPRKPGDTINYLGYYELTNGSIFKKQIELAKSHGIYGFAFYFYWFSGKTLLEKPLMIYLNDKDINFPFLLIWANENWSRKWDGGNKEILIKQDYKDDDPENFIKYIKKYLIDSRYIKINNKSVLGLYEPNKIPKLKKTIQIWRKKAIEYEIGELFILVRLNTDILNKYELFDGAYDFPPRNGFHYKVKFKNTFIYSELIYKNINFSINDKILRDFFVFRGSMLEWDNCPRVKPCRVFDYYSPEQFYIINKNIINWTKKQYNNSYQFIFINAWNEWGEGSYLEPDEKFGYASINSLSKSLFNLSYNNKYNLTYLIEKSKIAIQAHIYYEELINLIITKTNNIPCKFDLFISINNISIKNKLEKYVKSNSKAKLIEIKLFPNKGRDVLPLLIQLKNNIKNYKYICHLHTKKSMHIKFGEEWRNHLFENLVGNLGIISEILTDFENKENLGFIFPEVYYKILNIFGKELNDSNLKYMNYILKKLGFNYEISPNYFDFPEGNMFWAKVKAVYQIFYINIKNRIPKEKGQLNLTLIHAVERIWLYIVKLNGFYYKKIYKHI